jgi:6-phosphogluconolactonase
MRILNPCSLLLLGAVALSVQMPQTHAQDKTPANHSYLAFVGTYTQKESKGIYVYRYDPHVGHLSLMGLAAETSNPSFLVIHPNHRFLYAVNEDSNYLGPNSGGVSAFAIDDRTGKLTFLNEVRSLGASPCHLEVDKTGKYLLVANYDGGSVAVFPIEKDGRLGEHTDFKQHSGSSVNKERQEGPHAHSVNLSPDNRFCIVGDLGLDKLLVYRFDSTKGTLTPDNPPFAAVAPGSGPRHFAYDPKGKFAYAITEMGSTVVAFRYNAESGALHEIQTVSTLPSDFKGQNDDAEIAIDRTGRFLYGSNRGDNSIAVFSIDPAKGTLTRIQIAPTGGKEPRHFAIDPSGKYLFAENQYVNEIVKFRIDPETGKLTKTNDVVKVPSPICLVFLPLR